MTCIGCYRKLAFGQHCDVVKKSVSDISVQNDHHLSSSVFTLCVCPQLPLLSQVFWVLLSSVHALWVCVCIRCVLNTCPLSCRSTISSGPSRRSKCTERSGTTWLSPSQRRSATSRTTSPSTPESSRCQSSLFTYSVSSGWRGLSSHCAQRACRRRCPPLCRWLCRWKYFVY